MTREGDPRWLSLGKVPWDLCITATMVHLVNVNIKMTLNLNTLVLPGFQLKSPSEWSLRHASGRCVRKRGQASICKSGDGFVKVENVPLVATMTTIVSANKRS